MLAVHFHNDGGERHDRPVKPDPGTAHHCCGFISLYGLEPPVAVAMMPPQTTMAILPTPTPTLSGCRVVRLERPPKRS
jgi:hypothetical protein